MVGAGGQLVLYGTHGSSYVHKMKKPPKKEKENGDENGGHESDSSDSSQRSAEPGPPDMEKCTVSGTGFSGGSALTPVTLVITLRDEDGRKLKEGGDEVQVRVLPSAGISSKPAAGEEGASEGDGVIYPEVVDRGNGTYAATYTVPVKGMYKVEVQVEGFPIEGSPFPVFFGPPGEPSPEPPDTSASALVAAAAANAANLVSAAAPSGAAVAAPMPAATGTLPGLPMLGFGGLDAMGFGAGLLGGASGLGGLGGLPGFAGAMAGLSGMPGMGVAAPAALAPPVPLVDAALRSVFVANVTLSVSPEQVKAVFQVAGPVLNVVSLAQTPVDCMVVEFGDVATAQCALAFNGQMLGEGPVTVLMLTSAQETLALTNPLLLLKLQQIMQMQSAVKQSQQLAAQVRVSGGGWGTLVGRSFTTSFATMILLIDIGSLPCSSHDSAGVHEGVAGSACKLASRCTPPHICLDDTVRARAFGVGPL